MISKQEVKHIAKLARVDLNDKEIKSFEKDISSILDYFEMLREVNVSKVEPTFHPNEQKSGFLREDEAYSKPDELPEKLIELAPEKDKRHIKVKAVF